jgi:hypothetical protein
LEGAPFAPIDERLAAEGIEGQAEGIVRVLLHPSPVGFTHGATPGVLVRQRLVLDQVFLAPEHADLAGLQVPERSGGWVDTPAHDRSGIHPARTDGWSGSCLAVV